MEHMFLIVIGAVAFHRILFSPRPCAGQWFAKTASAGQGQWDGQGDYFKPGLVRTSSLESAALARNCRRNTSGYCCSRGRGSGCRSSNKGSAVSAVAEVASGSGRGAYGQGHNGNNSRTGRSNKGEDNKEELSLEP